MYICNVWAVLRVWPSECEEEVWDGLPAFEVRDAKSLELERLANEILNPRPSKCVTDVNWERVIQFSCSGNHRSTDYADLLHFLTRLTQLLPDSYGLAYWFDDEDPIVEYRNKFRVLVIASGKITERDDPFLSPYIPTVSSD
jgi:hypothetical protein